MKVKIWIENNKWLRADVIKKNGKLGRNLVHYSFIAVTTEQVYDRIKEVKDRVIFDNPNEKIEFVEEYTN